MEIHQLRYVQAIAETGSFTAAAARLYLAQPSLSVQVRKLEHELGAALFERSGRHVTLTAAGEVFLQHANRALGELDRARESVREAQRPAARLRVTLGVLPSVGAGLLPGALASLRREHPEVTVSVVERDSSEEFVDMVRTNRLDLAAVRKQTVQAELSRMPLAREPLAAVLPPGHPLAGRSETSLRALAGESYVAMPAGSALRELMESACRRVGFAPAIAIEARHLASVWAMVRAGIGICVLPELAADAGLPTVHIQEPYLHRDLVVVWRGAGGLAPPSRAIVRHLVSASHLASASGRGRTAEPPGLLGLPDPLDGDGGAGRAG
ncbi:LysR family transcriptional regulator [Streptomyces sp. NPDC058280]|uniref:LysR family transcriptional regulator n=1 Tax=Streptomyces sp. NPDC058280 TaxID=3346419 RepID=UPI0036E2AA1F